MSSRLFSFQFRSLLICCIALVSVGLVECGIALNACAQDDGGGGGDNNDTIGAGLTSGVAVDANGVLQALSSVEFGGPLMQQRLMQARANLDRDIARRSQLRKVSLTRLAKVVGQRIQQGHGPDQAMKNLAGLTRIQYVFYYPESKDIVIAGPAEGWMQNLAGRTVGIDTGHPIVELQDLAVALRAFPPGGESSSMVYCSIDATPEGLANMQQFLQNTGRYFAGGIDEQQIVQGLRDSLGMQVITLGGIPGNTHFAQVMVEADYRMKLIGIGLEPTPARFSSYIELANYRSIAANAMCRWWFVPDYQRVRVSEDGYAAELVGNGVKLVGEDEVVTGDGARQQTGRQNRASRKFTESFTRKYAEIARNAPVYGQLRNCVDLLVAAAFIQQNDLYGQAGWDLSVLGNEQAYPVQIYNAPERVAAAVNGVWKNRTFGTPIGGGVQIQAQQALSSENLLADEEGSVQSARDGIDLKELPADKWWWD